MDTKKKQYKKFIIISLIVILLISALIYSPIFQFLFKDFITAQISKATGWKVSVEKIDLDFPLDIELDGALALNAQNDTLIYAESFNVDTKFIPLLMLKIGIEDAKLSKAKYRFISNDSSLNLMTRIDLCEIKDAIIDLRNNNIKLQNGLIKNGNIALLFDKNKEKESPKDTTKSNAWNIEANEITLSNIHYTMNMLPTIDTLDAYVKNAKLKKGNVDTGKQTINAQYLGIDGSNVKYLLPATETDSISNNSEIKTTEDSSSADWTITADNISLKNANGIYAIKGITPVNGLDFNYIQVDDFGFEIEKFYNRGIKIDVPIKSISGKERCGLEIKNCSGTFNMDSTKLALSAFKLSTSLSSISINSTVSMSLLNNWNKGNASIIGNAAIDPAEIAKVFPNSNFILQGIPKYADVLVNIDCNYSDGNANINNFNINLQRYAQLKAKGSINNILAKNRKGNIKINGRFDNINFIKPTILPLSMHKEVELPDMAVNGYINLNGNQYGGDITIKSNNGTIALNGKINGINENYDFNLAFNQFPLHAIFPLYNIGELTANINASGSSFNPISDNSSLESEILISSIEYNKRKFTDINATVSLADNIADISLYSRNTALDLNANIKSTFKNNIYNYNIISNIADLNLYKLGFSDDELDIKGILYSSGIIDIDNHAYSATADINSCNLKLGESSLAMADANMKLLSDRDTTSIDINDNDLIIAFNSPKSIDSLLYEFSKCNTEINRQIENYSIDFAKLNQLIPEFDLTAYMGNNNIINNYLKFNDIQLQNLCLNVNKNSLLYITSKIENLTIGKTNLDTIRISGIENDSSLIYNIFIGNKRGNLNQIASTELKGMIGSNMLEVLLSQKNIDNKVGFNFGFKGNLVDNKIQINLIPDNPIIGYKNWTLNDNNFLEYGLKDKHFDANLQLINEKEHITIQSVHNSDSTQQDLLLNIKGLQLGEWINLTPLAPQIKGTLNANAIIGRNENKYTGTSEISVENLFYQNQKVGNFDFNLQMFVNPLTNHNEANAKIKIDGNNVISARGVINDSTATSPFQLALRIKRFPLSTTNAFFPSNITRLRGYINGKLQMSGSLSKPTFKGSLSSDSASVELPIFGSRLSFDKNPINIDSNKVIFKNFGVIGSNGNPIKINGNINIKDIYSPNLNLRFSGKNVQIVNSKFNTNTQVFGKGYIDIAGKASGKINQLNLDVTLNILERTNATYLFQSNMNEITKQQVTELVQFTEFNDTTSTKKEKSVSSFAMNLNTKIIINQGAILNVNLTPDGKNKVQIIGSGELDYHLNYIGDSRLIGRFTINNGFFRYYPPLISEKYFNFVPGSYVYWAGDMLNPTLSISAEANQYTTVVTDGSNPSRVQFLITANVTNSLKNMMLKFDLDAENNSTIQSDLQSMSAEQRSSQAMNLMLYNNYTGMQSSSASATNTNMLYSFLSSQINNWTSKLVQGVDITFGINEYSTNSDNTKGTGMNYSYQISKSLLNDRLKMTIGGNYDTNTTTNNSLAQNLLSNVSFEYALNASGNMSIKLYNKLSNNNIYQTQVNETGVAFVLRRKLNTLKDIFKFNIKPKTTKSDSLRIGKREIVNDDKE
ncbi:MAG: translocation/assembly module TamB domain-containing protein [Muribaculaceae bacterium]|nr:translocation/assembly module TamB domain-containing protein [Muribaculaceae bacterium]